MTDIVGRLRQHRISTDWRVSVSEAHEAADEIVRLTAENERLRQKIKDLTSDLLFVTGWNAGFEHAIQEALNLKFPAHIRKMWSGDEVQKWIDHKTSEARAALKEGET